MHQKIFEDSQALFMPFTKVMQANMEAFDKLRESQTKLVTELLQDSVDHMTALSKAESDVSKVIDKQQHYFETLSAKFEKTFEENCELLSKAQAELSSVLGEAKMMPPIKAEAPKAKKAAAKPSVTKAGATKDEAVDKTSETQILGSAAEKSTVKSKPASKTASKKKASAGKAKSPS